MATIDAAILDADGLHRQNPETVPVDDSPSVTFESITFSDDTTIHLQPDDVVVFVGPNNSGKSVALRELEERVGNSGRPLVIKDAKIQPTGTPQSFLDFIKPHVQITQQGSNFNVAGNGFSIGFQRIEDLWPANFQVFRSLFCAHILTEERITGSNQRNSIDSLNELPSHPIHILYSDDQVETRISRYFRRAFGSDLIVDRAAGRVVPLRVGAGLKPQTDEDRVSKTYTARLRQSTIPLQEQGDGMRSFATVVLHVLAPTTPSVLLLDEPEAFLHPPQARLLGEIIAKERSPQAQLFVATHSTDVLQGLVNAASNNLRVLRMQRDGNVNRIKELDKEKVRTMSVDPLLKHSSVMSGLFHERVIICESDADCLFYASLLDLSEVHGERHPDVLFVHANGKDRMASLARTLVALGVPVDIVADIDIVRDENTLQKVIQALNGDWPRIQPSSRRVRAAIEDHRPRLTADEVTAKIRAILDTVQSEPEFPKSKRAEVEVVFRQASEWEGVKHAGEAALPFGQPTQEFQQLRAVCKKMGLWIVPVGEVEGFCRSVGGHGPGWVQNVMVQKDLANDPELNASREFVREIWQSK